MKTHGQNISEMVIILVLIGIVGILALTVLGGNIKTMFSGAKSGLDSYNAESPILKAAGYNNSGNTIALDVKAGDYGGTPDNPVQKCDGDNCNIDFGTFTLNNVPEDFNKYIESAGSAGGTDKLVALMKQIAAQLEATGNFEDAERIKRLASLGHNIALTERVTEQLIVDCNNDKTCLEKYLSQESTTS
jgi:Flp pilus assembly pilin Flp